MTLPSENDMCDLFTDIMKESVQLSKALDSEQIDKEAMKAIIKRINAGAGLGKSVMSYKAIMG